MLRSILLSLLFLVVFGVTHAPAQTISILDRSADEPRLIELNKSVGLKLRLPFFVMVPQPNFLDISNDLVSSSEAGSPAIVFNYLRPEYFSTSESATPLQNRIGFRMSVLNGTESRAKSSATLAKSGLIKNGDIVLSFRPEWYGTLKYSHVQMGVSHAGLMYIDKSADGVTRAHNVDMPLDEATHGVIGKNYLQSKHYLEAPTAHIVRPRALHDGVNDEVEGANILKWAKRFANEGKKAYRKDIFFNSDYASPKYKLSPEGNSPALTFVADLARIALGKKPNQPVSMFCSEFAWAVLSLRDCNPDDKNFVTELDAQKVPTCISEIMEPMAILGNVNSAKVSDPSTGLTDDGEKLSVGIGEGPLTVISQMRNPEDPNALLKAKGRLNAIFQLAKGQGKHISEGHLAVEKSLIASNPTFFDDLLAYYTGVLGFQGMGREDESSAKLNFARLAFNSQIAFKEGQPVTDSAGRLVVNPPSVNYSPTAFLVHAVLPSQLAVKKFDYVTTLLYVPEAEYSKVKQAATR